MLNGKAAIVILILILILVGLIKRYSINELPFSSI